MVFLEYMFCIYLNGKIVVAIDAVILLILEVFQWILNWYAVSTNVIKIMKMKYLNSKNCGITKCKF